MSKGGSDRNHILWIRHYKMDRNGAPINIRRIGKDIPTLFFKMCSGVTKRGRFECTLNLKSGYTYYQLGVFLARHDSLFRKYMPEFDIRSLREIKDGVALKEGRFYKESRALDDLQEITTDFSQEGDMTDIPDTTNTNTVPAHTPNMFEANNLANVSQANPFTQHRSMASTPNTNFGVQNGADGMPVSFDKMDFV